MSKGRIITGPQDPGDTGEPEMPEMQIPLLNNYWVVWFNPQTEKIERVGVAAHTVEVSDSGMLVFKAFVKNTDPGMLAVGAPPVYGYYMKTFCGHITMNQEIPSQTIQ